MRRQVAQCAIMCAAAWQRVKRALVEGRWRLYVAPPPIFGGSNMKPANDNPLGKVYNLDEAAEYLRLSNRKLARVAQEFELCSKIGRDFLFSESDLKALWDVLRKQTNSASSSVGILGTSAEKSKALPASAAYSRALARVTAKEQMRSGSRSRAAS
ncbi:MAG: helix-turn-helix domain-containing protein [Mesorhizobium sp.]|nr:MAG: helix-turn-helix domain-containing protein [Mesorhizobium sp.]